MGCKEHALLVKISVIEDCEVCNNIDWDKIGKDKTKETA
jgi:hypothetical protein